MFNKLKNVVRCSFICAIIITSCDQNKNGNNTQDGKENFNNNCLNELVKYSKKLSLDSGKKLNEYFNKTNDPFLNCDFKHYRDSIAYDQAIILIILKLHNHDLKSNYHNVMAGPRQDLSKSLSRIINEYAYLYYGKDKYFDEELHMEDVMTIVERNPYFLKDSLIKMQIDSARILDMKKR